MTKNTTNNTPPAAPARIQADRPAAPKGPHYCWPQGSFGRIIRVGR